MPHLIVLNTSSILSKTANLAVFFIIAFCALETSASAPPTSTTETVQEIRIPKVYKGTDPFYNYVKELLEKALASNADKYGKAVLVSNPEPAVQDRQLRNLGRQFLDITWSVTSIDRERRSRAVYIPISAGLFGQRVFFIQKQDPRFDTPIALSKLQALRAIQEESWPDMKIFRQNGFNVVGGRYRSAFKMLEQRFVDYFPRGVLEIEYELEANRELDIAMEQHILVSYASPMFFFVDQNNTVLAERIEAGLKTLIENGEFQQLLEKQSFYQSAMEIMQVRTLYRLNNPLLSAQTLKAIEKYFPLTKHYNVN